MPVVTAAMTVCAATGQLSAVCVRKKLRAREVCRIAKKTSGRTLPVDFNVLLTVHLGIILVINQLNAQNLVL